MRTLPAPSPGEACLAQRLLPGTASTSVLCRSICSQRRLHVVSVLGRDEKKSSASWFFLVPWPTAAAEAKSVVPELIAWSPLIVESLMFKLRNGCMRNTGRALCHFVRLKKITGPKT